jgi:hypothetical protein
VTAILPSSTEEEGRTKHPTIDDRHFFPTAELQAALKGTGRIDSKVFREDIDAYVDQDPTPLAWPQGWSEAA